MPEVGGVNRITQSCFAMEIRVLGKPISGNINEPQGVE